MKKLIAAAIIVIILSCAYLLPTVAENNEFHYCLTVVTNKEQVEGTNLWLIYCQDKNGDIWAFFDDDGDWDNGDLANLLMKDDEVIEVYWEGYVRNVDTFFALMGQR